MVAFCVLPSWCSCRRVHVSRCDTVQVADGNVVYKTRARRLYDIANALAALGLVEKVRHGVHHLYRAIGVAVKSSMGISCSG